MKNSLVQLSIIFFIIVSVLQANAQNVNKSKIQFVNISNKTIDKSLPEVPWITNGFNFLVKNNPLFSINSNDSETAAKGWVGVNKNEVIIRIIVTDDYHINKQTGANIYDGDAIQFGIDANGDGNIGQEKNMAYTGPDDASITVALTEDGPKAWAHYYGHPDGAGSFSRINLSIKRNEKNQSTTYDIKLPWKAFQTDAGISPNLALAFQINDTDKGPKQKRIYWGNGAGGNLRPGLFKKLTIGKPNEDFISINSVKNKIWTKNDKAEVIVAINSEKPVTISAKYKKILQKIEYSNTRGLQRYLIIAKPGELILDKEKLFISAKTKNKKLAKKEINLTSPDDLFGEFQKKINQLVATSPHPLYTKHLLSLKAIITDEWNKSFSLLNEDPLHIKRAHKYIGEIIKGLEEIDYTWSDFSNGRRELLISFMASSDRTLQFYRLTLPQNWDKNKEYPLIVNLHGTGSPYPLDFFSEMFKSSQNEILKDNVNALIVAPWGRGNFRYKGVAESDVWDAMNSAKKMINIDNTKQYLTGFSMGGFGTWMLSVFKPEKWAAIAVCAGADKGASSELGFATNIAQVPVLIWHGKKDGTVPITHAYTMQKALQKVGNNPDMILVPNRGHSMNPKDVLDVNNWLLSHTRTTVTKFSYIVSSKKHNGRNGVTVLELKNIITNLPKIDVEIYDNIVEINTEGTSIIQVKMGKDGLELVGETKIIWNGETVYEGEVTERVFYGNFSK